PAQKQEPKRMDLAEAEKLVREHVVTVQIPAIQNPPDRFPLKELTTDAIWKRLHVQVYQVSDTFLQYETYVIKGGKTFLIGNRPGGFGVISLGVADLGKSGQPGLIYCYSWGSGVHRAQFAFFDVGAKEPKEHVAPQCYFSKTIEDPTLKVLDDQKVEVYL